MDEELFIYAVMAVGLAVAFGLRWHHRGRVVDVRHVKAFGSFDAISAYLVRSPRGRDYVALEYVVVVEGTEYEKQVLLSIKQAAALANHLRVAASPHASLVAARVAVRRNSASARLIEGSTLRTSRPAKSSRTLRTGGPNEGR